MTEPGRAAFPRSVLVAAFLTAVAPTFALSQPAATAEAACVLPEKLREAVVARFGSARVLQKSDLYQDERELFVKDRSDACPGLVTGRFFGPSERPATALVLVDVGDSKKIRLVVARPATSSWVFHEAAELDAGTTAIVRRASPGRYEAAEGSRVAESKNEVLQLVAYDAWTRVFIWTAGKFESLRVKD